ncbi:hypothetical protein AX16_005629 [Volvariella volvacea WC 439]|nr:hypothetical protein AX16_005629 [Volvariella volvacea WC 439]
MRGEIFLVTSAILSLVATLLMIFVHVGQINLSRVPRSISMLDMNATGYGDALHDALLVPIEGLYTDNASIPLQQRLGIRNYYNFGLYSYCGYINDTVGTCTNRTTAALFQPYEALTMDMRSNYSVITRAILFDNTRFADSENLGTLTRAAYYTLLLGTICAALAFILGVLKFNLTFFASAVLAILGSIFLLVGASIWTAMVNRVSDVNNFMIGTDSNPSLVGISVSAGNGLHLAWASFACLLVSIVPYMISCCTLR